MFRIHKRWKTNNAAINYWLNVQPPKSRKVVFKANASKIKKKNTEEIISPTVIKEVNARFNKLNIQMLSKSLYEQLFKNYPQMQYANELITKCKKDLEKHGMVAKEELCMPDVNIKLPPLEGRNLEEHFKIIAENQAKPYKELISKLLKRIPERPSIWSMEEGWTRYVKGEKPQKVDNPLEASLIFDVEVCMRQGKAPTLATACSDKAWYGWVSNMLIDGNDKAQQHLYHDSMLVPFGNSKNAQLVVGHNVSFDRAKIKEQYYIEHTGMRFLDTMSLHVCVSGVTSYQRAVLKSKDSSIDDEEWKSVSSLNNLSDVHRLYCGSPIEKSQRDLFVEGNLSDIRLDFQKCMDYCASDVQATHSVLKVLYKLFDERFPHPVTFAGMLELGTAYLPVNQNWNRYLEDAEQTYEDLEAESKIALAKRADQACNLLHNDNYRNDIWMWDLDWSIKELKIKKSDSKQKKIEAANMQMNEGNEELDPLDVKFAYLEKQKCINTLLAGYPTWYRKLCVKPGSIDEWIPGPHLISTSMQVTPKLLNLTWEGYPLHYIRGLGWGFLVPFTDAVEATTIPIKKLLEKCPLVLNKNESNYQPDIRNEVQNNLARKEYYSKVKDDKSGGVYKGSGIWTDTILDECAFFFKLPHKNGAAYRVGNPLAKDFLNKFSENVLAGDTECAEHVLDNARKLSYWRNNRDRIMQQMVVWLPNECGAIIPQVVVSGTLTRRAVEPTWMTASNASVERIGSELRAMIQAPEGYKLVGADVDSQELWIASVIGDANYAKMHGATPLGWMTLSGSKADATDMHSVTAKTIGISRDHAKVINYARIYGAGQNFAEQLLRQFNPSMNASEARSKAMKMFEFTKGKRIYQLRPEFICELLPDVSYSKWRAHDIAKMHNKTLNEMFYKPRWVGGTESAMFNSLEDIATLLKPKTPFLEGRLTRALEPQHVPDERFLPTRVNWVVQSGAVDFLHLMLVCMRWLLKDKGRFCLSFHDDVRYLVKEEFKYDAALALHITNLLTRAYCSIKLGIYDLPQSVAFFSCVEVDNVLRKDAKQDCKTPSNPYGLEKGYGIPNGESLNVYEAVEKANGTTSKWYS